jgi:hypothetical protein
MGKLIADNQRALGLCYCYQWTYWPARLQHPAPEPHYLQWRKVRASPEQPVHARCGGASVGVQGSEVYKRAGKSRGCTAYAGCAC